MTNKEKQLLLIDLCARLPYGVKIKFDSIKETVFTISELGYLFDSNHDIIPYLRPMSSMTDGEKEELKELTGGIIQYNNYGSVSTTVCGKGYPHYWCTELSDWAKVGDFLIRRHFDYNKLIEKGLALEAPEGMY